MGSVESPWEFDNDLEESRVFRPWFKNRGRKETYGVHARLPQSTVREIDVYVASRADPQIQTRTDFIQAAIYYYITAVKGSTPGIKPIRILANIENLKAEMEYYSKLLDDCSSTLDLAVRENNMSSVKRVYDDLTTAKATFQNKSGTLQQNKLDYLIQRCVTILSVFKG